MNGPCLRIGNMKKIVLCVLMLMAMAGVLRADTVSFDATVNSSKISLNEVLQLTLTVAGVKDNLDPSVCRYSMDFLQNIWGLQPGCPLLTEIIIANGLLFMTYFPTKPVIFKFPLSVPLLPDRPM